MYTHTHAGVALTIREDRWLYILRLWIFRRLADQLPVTIGFADLSRA